MSDILTRLLLKTDDFDRNLSRAKQNVGSFEGKITGMASKAGAGLLRLAGGIGVAMTAAEGFNKVMSSSQVLSDEYNRTMDGLKGSVDEFFYSIGSGDWTNFFNGLDGIIQRAREAYDALDQLGNTRISFSLFDMKNQSALQESMAVLKDKNATKEQIREAKELGKRALDDQLEIVGQYKRRSIEAMQALVAQSTGLNKADVSLMNFEKTLRLDVSATGDADKARLKAQYEEYVRKVKEVRDKNTSIQTITAGGLLPTISKTLDEESYNRDLAPLLKQYEDAIYYNGLLNKKTDEQLTSVKDIVMASYQADKNYQSMVKSFNRASQGNQNVGGGGKAKKEVEIVPSGSFAELDKLISGKKKELSVAVSDDSRFHIQKELDGMVSKRRWMEIEVKFRKFEEKGGLEKDMGKVRDAIKAMGKVPELPKRLVPFTKKDVKNNNDYANSLYSVGYAFGSLSSMSAQFNNDGLSFMFGMMGNIAQMVTQLNALTIANGVASASKLPFPASLAAMATVVATVGSIFASLPKFADGGIIGGGSFFGDNLIARVNSGEMILNQRQQSNLFKMIDGKQGSGTIEITGGISKVRGSDIYLSLKNYMKTTGKKL